MSILDGQDGGAKDLVDWEADTITISVLVGFLATRAMLEQPVTLSYEDPGVQKWDEHKKVSSEAWWATDVLQKVVKAGGYDPSFFSLWTGSTPSYDGQSNWAEHFAITGLPGGACEMFGLRGRKFRSETMKGYVRQILQGLKQAKEYGAYYGVVDDPVRNDSTNFMASSVRRLIDYNGSEGVRWNAQKKDHGLIYAGNARQFTPQAGSFEDYHAIERWNGDGKVVGYCHGMNWAIMMSKVMGPWATPYELAIGTNTTKLASCMGCTTFMYASGFVPSAIHIGRADSWVPLPPDGGNSHLPGWSKLECIAGALNEIWARDVYQYLQLGARILRRSPLLKEDAKSQAKRLDSYALRRTNIDCRAAANIYLDALTVHRPEIERMMHVFKDPPRAAKM